MKRIFYGYLAIVLVAFAVTSPVSGAAGEVIKVKVNGLVCDFCARALEKTFDKEAAVASIDVDLTAKILTVTLAPGASINDEELEKLVVDSGYNVEEISRN